jgi:protein-L-isoaspartate(D-aspartate) O-methyltransferase
MGMTVTVGSPSSADVRREQMVDRLVQQVHPREETVAAFRAVPRHLFLPDVDLDRVYSGAAIPTKHGDHGDPISSSSEVAIMALMVDALRLERGQHLLEIGTGTGYNAAILAELVGAENVVTLEIDAEIADEARAHLRAAGYEDLRVEAFDGWMGWTGGAPYARIELTAATSDISPHWVDQLEEGGILVAPVMLRPNAQAMVALRKSGETLESLAVFAGGFMWLRGVGATGGAPREIGPWRVTSSRPVDGDRLLALLQEKPTLDLAEPCSWSDLALLAIADENSLVVQRNGSPAFSNGVLADDGKSLALVEWTGGTLSPQLLLVSYGGPEALEKLRHRLDEVRGHTWQGLRIVAVPSGGARPEGEVVFVCPNYTFGVKAKR